MSGRTPSFIVVGLVIIMLLLGIFYMSCSSKNTELRLSVEQFEDRIRSLSIKNSDSEKKVESINSRKRELEEDKLNIQRQMEKKDSEINDLNTKLNERSAELQSLKSDKNVLDEQLKEFKSMSETLAERNSLIEKLQKQLQDQKEAGADELIRVRQEYEALKGNPPSQNNQLPSANEQQNNFQIAPDRFRPLLSNNPTTRSIPGFFHNSLNRLNNLTREVKAQIIPAANEVKDKVLDAIGITTNSSANVAANEQQQVANSDRDNQGAAQNVPPPQLDNNALPGARLESAQGAPHSANRRNQDNQPNADNAQLEQRMQRSLNDSNADNGNGRPAENDDEERLELNVVPDNNKPASSLLRPNGLGSNNALARDSLPSRFDNTNYRVGDRDQNRNRLRNEQRADNGEEVENDDENDEPNQRVQKRNVL